MDNFIMVEYMLKYRRQEANEERLHAAQPGSTCAEPTAGFPHRICSLADEWLCRLDDRHR